MSLNLTRNKARLTVFGYGWDDEVVDSGDGSMDEGTALEEYVDNTDYDFPDMDWDAVADDWGLELDEDGTFTDETLEMLDGLLYDLSLDADAIYDYMLDKSDSTGIPARIVVTQLPEDTEYVEGETIDYTGIIVCAYASENTATPFINSNWEGDAHNQVPFNELTFPVTEAKPSSKKTSDFGIEVDALYSDDFPVTADIHIIRYSTHRHSYPPYDNSSYKSMETDRFHGRWDEPAIYPYAALVQSTPTNEKYNGEITETYDDYRLWVAGASREYASESDGYYHYSDYYVHNHKSIWLNGGYWWGAGNLVIINPNYNLYAEYETETNVPIITTDGTHKIAQYLWTAIYGDADSDVTIPVQWQTEYQTDPFEDTFDITVTEAED